MGMKKKKKKKWRQRLLRTKYFDALQGLEAARKYIQQFDMEDILVTCGKLENKLYTLKHQEKGKQITIFDCLKKQILF
jgi:hypothetical protein